MQRSSSIITLALTAAALSAPVAAQCDPALDAYALRSLDGFGWSCGLSGDWAAIGCPGDQDVAYKAGAVRVREWVAGAWVERQKIYGSDSWERDHFGYSVDVDGDTLVVGAPSNANGGYRRGAVYVFVKSGDTWTETQKLGASDASDSDEFGWSVSLDGDRLLVGARAGDKPGAQNSGTAYFFDRAGGVFTQTQEVWAGDGAAVDYFGHRVDLDGDVAVVGCHGNDDFGTGTGSAYIYRNNAGTWSQEKKLRPGTLDSLDYFGYDVAIEGDVVVCGAQGWDGNFSSQGAVFIYRKVGANWIYDQYFPGVHDGGQFGHSVELQNGLLLAGANRGAGLQPEAGDAVLLVDNGNTFNAIARVLARDGVTGDRFGASVAMDGDRFLIGAIEKAEFGSESGGAYGYRLPFVDADLNGEQDDCESGVSEFCPCTTASCGNPGAHGCTNSTGQSGRLLQSGGSLSFLADDLLLRAEGLPPNQFALLFMGDGIGSPVALGDGQRCTTGALRRFPVALASVSGTVDLGPRLVSQSHTHPSGGIVPGQTWRFQLWYRDPGGTCGASNLTNGLSISFEN